MTSSGKTSRTRILGVILAGGSATRMFPDQSAGGDKGLVDLGGQPMLAHVIARFRPQVGHLILNANGRAERFQAFDIDVVGDDPASQTRGPLAGLQTAMQWALNSGRAFHSVATVTTDVPFLPRDLAARLLAKSSDVPVLAASGGHRHPAIGVWPVALATKIAEAAAGDDWSLGRLVNRLSGLEVDFPLGESGGRLLDPFFNANTPDDLETARTLIEH